MSRSGLDTHILSAARLPTSTRLLSTVPPSTVKSHVTVSTGATNQSWGVQTAYCVLKSGVRCPNWVTFSLTNPGIPNPKRAVSPTTASAPNSGSPKKRIQAPADDIQVDEYTVFSYEPLPVGVDATLVQQAQDDGVPLHEIS